MFSFDLPSSSPYKRPVHAKQPETTQLLLAKWIFFVLLLCNSLFVVVNNPAE